MNSMKSMFRFALLALVGTVLVAYAVSHEIAGLAAAEPFDRFVDAMPVLKATLSLPPGIIVAVAGLMMLTISVYRLHVLWTQRRPTARRLIPVPAVNDRNPQRHPTSRHDAEEQEFDGEEYGPGASYDSPRDDRYRGNGRYDSRWAESYR
jgi:hypothetical protein